MSGKGSWYVETGTTGPYRFTRLGNVMKQITFLSYAITVLGVMLVTTAIAAGLSALWLLSGMLLVIAGVVKIAVVHIWQRIAGL